MGYLHINNLYRDVRILSFKEVYALEKIHGTSANVSWRDQKLHFSSGGMSGPLFQKIFDEEKLAAAFKALGQEDTRVIVFGEAYGGKEQGMRETYGPIASFIVFDVKIGDSWLDVPKAEAVATALGLVTVTKCLLVSN